MSREIYKRVSPHLQRVLADGGTAPSNMSDLFLLQQSNEKYKDVLKLTFCPELYGNNIRTYNGVNYIQKSYSANSIQQELGPNLVVNGDFNNGSFGWATSTYLEDWTFNNSTVKHTGNASNLRQTILITNKVYSITIVVKSITIGVMDIHLGLGNVIGHLNSIGNFTFKAQCSGNNVLYLDCNQSCNIELDLVSVQEVLYTDLTQTSSSNQPYLDKIAPTERLSAKNPNGGSNYLTHPTVSFGANDEWTVETTLNEFCKNSGNFGTIGDTGNTTKIGLFNGITDLRVQLYGNNINSIFNYNTARFSGKNTILTITYKANVFNCYLNGINVGSMNANNTSFTFNTLLYGVFFNSNGTISSHHILSKALSPTQVAERASILRSIFPEIPFTRIGDQIWSVRNFEAVVTPQGNLIPEMQANGNVERIVNGGFDTDTGWTKNTGVTISGGTLNFTNAAAGYLAFQDGVISNGKWYKIQFTYSNVTGGCGFLINGLGIGSGFVGTGTYSFYALGTSGNGRVQFQNNSGAAVSGSIDNVSIQEIGWSGSQELYNGIFNQRKTVGDTDEQATYTAVKAAAMWCHYNNDFTLGAVYCKLYNWFAVKLLQMDIDYYNAANPTTPWGWRVPTQADFNTLATNLGGTNVAGGKMKMQGTAYWNSPNTGADNSSGFSAIGNGSRFEDGSYTQIQTTSSWYTLDYPTMNYLSNSSNQLLNVSLGKQRGASLRLIKS